MADFIRKIQMRFANQMRKRGNFLVFRFFICYILQKSAKSDFEPVRATRADSPIASNSFKKEGVL